MYLLIRLWELDVDLTYRELWFIEACHGKHEEGRRVMNTPYIIFIAISLAWKNSNSMYGYLVFPYCMLFFFASSLLLSSLSQILYTAFEFPGMHDS